MTAAVARHVGLVGFGRMGGAFGPRLVAGGHRVTVVEPDPDRCAAATAAGCAVADGVTEMLADAPDVVILSLPTEEAFAQVVAAIARHHGGRPLVVADTSTLSLDAKERARRELDAAGVGLLDCPVSGTGDQAARGDVIVYASGPDDDVDAVTPVLESFARTVHRLGPFGTATKVKFLANILVGIHNAATAEVLALAAQAGLDPAALVPVLADGAGQSRMLEVRGPAMASGDYGSGATIEVYRKDLGLIGAFVDGLDGYVPLLSVVDDLYERAAARGLADADPAAVHAVYLEPDVVEPDVAP